jgi:hypothetical protein
MSNYGLFSDLSGVWIVLAHKTDHVCGNSLQIVLADFHGGNGYLAVEPGGLVRWSSI